MNSTIPLDKTVKFIGLCNKNMIAKHKFLIKGNTENIMSDYIIAIYEWAEVHCALMRLILSDSNYYTTILRTKQWSKEKISTYNLRQFKRSGELLVISKIN